MNTTPKSLRLQIALFGRTNVGKSSLLNYLAGQDVAIVSPIPGTTTDVVEKPMELLPIGPVVFLDTAGLDDVTELADRRLLKTRAVLDRADVIVVVCDPSGTGPTEDALLAEAAARKLPVLAVGTKSDLGPMPASSLQRLRAGTSAVLSCSCVAPQAREAFLAGFKAALLEVCPEDFVQPPPLLGDLLCPGGLLVMVVPIDLQAPRGRLILPQVQSIRDALDHDAAALVLKEREYADYLRRIGIRPDLVVCDSQVVLKMAADTPPDVPCTTFSILFARSKGDLPRLAAGAAAIHGLRAGDRVLVAESCAHHALEDDIGRVKIPRWLRQFSGVGLTIEHCAGRDFPSDLAGYDLVVQCGGCMNNRREMLARLQRAAAAGVPMTNYGLCISVTQGVIGRVLAPFPAARAAYERARCHFDSQRRGACTTT